VQVDRVQCRHNTCELESFHPRHGLTAMSRSQRDNAALRHATFSYDEIRRSSTHNPVRMAATKKPRGKRGFAATVTCR
jgi:hypothetical protein